MITKTHMCNSYCIEHINYSLPLWMFQNTEECQIICLKKEEALWKEKKRKKWNNGMKEKLTPETYIWTSWYGYEEKKRLSFLTWSILDRTEGDKKSPETTKASGAGRRSFFKESNLGKLFRSYTSLIANIRIVLLAFTTLWVIINLIKMFSFQSNQDILCHDMAWFFTRRVGY